MFDSYGSKILYDFRVILGVDVKDYLKGLRGWKEFYAYLNELPSWSKTKSAMAGDVKLAEYQVSKISEDEIQRIRDSRVEKNYDDLTLEGYTEEIERLNIIADKLEVLISALSSGKEKREVRPAPRPKTAYNKAIEKRILALEEREQMALQAEFGF